MADVEAPTTSLVQVDLHPVGSSDPRYSSLGRQLRSSIRFHLRLPRRLRSDAFHLIRPLRSSSQDLADMDLFDPDRCSVHLVTDPVLQRAGVRVRSVQAVQLHTVHP